MLGVERRMPSPSAFSVTWDYRCPFARNAHEHILDGLASGAPWQVSFVPFFLDQCHVGEGDVPSWEDPARRPDLLPIEAAIVVRDRFSEHFLTVHRALFAARHDQGANLRDRSVVRDVLTGAGADAAAVLAEVDTGWPRTVARAEHERVAHELEVFGVPTFIVEDRAAFARVMTRPEGNGQVATETIDRIVELVTAHPELNELKHTRVPR